MSGDARQCGNVEQPLQLAPVSQREGKRRKSWSEELRRTEIKIQHANVTAPSPFYGNDGAF